jgi:phage-related protein
MILSMALCVGAIAPRVSAQGVPANRDINWGEVSAFDAYLDQHPAMAQQLSANPGLVRNQEYLERHQGLRNFLSTNPSVRDELTETPGWFMNRETQYRTLESTNGGLNRVEMDNLDRYLDTHPDVAHELAARPGLADNHEYLEQHAELREFLVRHPAVWSQFRAHPNWLMFREQRFQSHEASATDNRYRDRDYRDRGGDYGRRDWKDGDRNANYRRDEVEHRDRHDQRHQPNQDDAAYRNRETNYGENRGDREWNAQGDSRQLHANPVVVNRPPSLEHQRMVPVHPEVAEAHSGMHHDRQDDGQRH